MPAVDHELKGLQYRVEDENPVTAIDKLRNILETDAESRTTEFLLEMWNPKSAM